MKTTPVPIQVRRATIVDIDPIVRRNLDLARESEGIPLCEETLTNGVRRLFQDNVDAHYYIAMIDGHDVGQCMVTKEWSDWRNGYVWWFQSVYVDQQARGQGVYKALHHTVLHEARSEKAVGVRLYVDKQNTSAMSVYKKMGMDGDHYTVFEDMFKEDR